MTFPPLTTYVSTTECRDQDCEGRCALHDAPATETYWVSIGRNVGAEPMSDQDWWDFLAMTNTACLRAGDVLTNVRGRSFWGVTPEETYLCLVAISTPWGLADLRTSLGRLASLYHRDAIGLVGGAGETLVRP